MPSVLLYVSWSIVALTALLAVRLARSSWRARSLPEGLLAAFFTAGAAGYGLLMLRSTLGLPPEAYAPIARVAGWIFLVPFLTVVLFTWQVFQRDSKTARALALGLASTGVASMLLGEWIAPALGMPEAFNLTAGTPAYFANLSIRATAFGWASFEAGRYYASARRRTRLGLADPIVANRFLLWSLWSGSALSMLVLRAISQAVVDPTSGETSPLWLMLAQMGAGITCGTTVWLTFAAPAFYKNWILGAAQSPAQA